MLSIRTILFQLLTELYKVLNLYYLRMSSNYKLFVFRVNENLSKKEKISLRGEIV